MARCKFSKEEVKQWQEEHHQSVFYINKNGSNLFVKRRYSFGWTVNHAHPGAWVIILAAYRTHTIQNIPSGDIGVSGRGMNIHV
jgi:uncharacterized membrane protein